MPVVMAADDATLEILRPDLPARVGRIGGIVLAELVGHAPEIHGTPQVEFMRALDDAARFERVAMLARIRDSRPPPDDDRRELKQRLEAMRGRLATVEIAIEGGGFRNVAFRSFVSALRLIGVVRVPIILHGSFEVARERFAADPIHTPRIANAITEFFGDPAGA